MCLQGSEVGEQSTMGALTVVCTHVDTDEQHENHVALLVAVRDGRGLWIDVARGHEIGQPRRVYEAGHGLREVPGRGRRVDLRCSVCRRQLERRARVLGRDLDACAAAGMDRVDLRLLELRASSVR